MNVYKCTYTEINRNADTKTYGQMVEHTREFKTFREAVSYSRRISNTNVNMIGKPLIIIEEPVE